MDIMGGYIDTGIVCIEAISWISCEGIIHLGYVLSDWDVSFGINMNCGYVSVRIWYIEDYIVWGYKLLGLNCVMIIPSLDMGVWIDNWIGWIIEWYVMLGYIMINKSVYGITLS